MLPRHEFAPQFIEHMRTTQQAYAQRRLEDYLAGFADSYASVQLHTGWSEDKAALREKIQQDMQRFDLLSMDFEVLQDWYSGELAFALLRYLTRLQLKDGRVLADRRENIIVCQHRGAGRWEIVSKIVIRAESFYE